MPVPGFFAATSTAFGVINLYNNSFTNINLQWNGFGEVSRRHSGGVACRPSSNRRQRQTQAGIPRGCALLAEMIARGVETERRRRTVVSVMQNCAFRWRSSWPRAARRCPRMLPTRTGPVVDRKCDGHVCVCSFDDRLMPWRPTSVQTPITQNNLSNEHSRKKTWCSWQH